MISQSTTAECGDDNDTDEISLRKCNNKTIVYILRQFVFKTFNNPKINDYQDAIISYLVEKHIDGAKIVEMNGKIFATQISTHCNNKKLNAPLKKIFRALTQFDVSKITLACIYSFMYCKSAIRIKTLLQKYNKIISDKTDKSKSQMENDIDELINKTSFNGTYSNIKLMNDFYHIKYDHQTNDNLHEFDSFYNYLCDNHNALKCDIDDCFSAKRYYSRRRAYDPIQNSNSNHSLTLKILCRIHTYFIHAYDTVQLNGDEIQFIETTLNESKNTDEDLLHDEKFQLLSTAINNKRRSTLTLSAGLDYSKFTTKDVESINCQTLSSALAMHHIIIEQNRLINVFHDYGYDKLQLIDDLCNVLLTEEEEDVLLSEILKNEFNYDENQSQIIYGIICHQYVMMNTTDFVKILQATASKYIPDVICDEIAKIAADAKLNGNVFVKGTTEFKNSINFAKMFKSITNWDKKQWTKIYKIMNKWKTQKRKATNTVRILATQKNKNDCSNNQEIELKDDKLNFHFIEQENKYNEEHQYNEENKYNEEIKTIDHEDQMDYIDQGTDSYIIQQFIALTSTSTDVAISFLKESEWNIVVAVNKYYSVYKNTPQSKSVVDEQERNQTENRVYNYGISFWYW
eukprot:335680_1